MMIEVKESKVALETLVFELKLIEPTEALELKVSEPVKALEFELNLSELPAFSQRRSR